MGWIKRVSSAKELYEDEEFRKLKTEEEILTYLLEKYYPDGIESVISELRQSMNVYQVERNQKSLSLAKVYESVADEMLQTNGQIEPVQVENLYSKAINILPMCNDDPERPCSHRVRLYTKRARTRFDMRQFHDALSDIYLAIRFGDEDVVSKQTQILALKCLIQLKAFNSTEREAINLIIEHLLLNSNPELPEHLVTLISNQSEKYWNKSNFFHNERFSSRVNYSLSEDYFRYEVDERWKICTDEIVGRFPVATDDISEGTTLLVEKPYMTIVTDEMRMKICNYCLGKIDNPNQAYPCENCNEAFFCSIDCFEEAFAVYHQFECGFLGLIDYNSLGVYRILSGIGLEKALGYQRNFQSSSFTIEEFLENKSLQLKSNLELDGGEQMALYRMFTSLVDHSDKRIPITDAFNAIKAFELAQILAAKNNRLFDGENLDRNFYDLFKLCVRHLTRIRSNAFGQFEYSENQACSQLSTFYSLISSFINHSCEPNLTWDIHHGQIFISAKRPIKKGEVMTITYRGKSSEFIERQARFYYGYYFFCHCPVCRVDAKQLTTFFCPMCKDGPVIFTSHRIGCQICQQEVNNGQKMREKFEQHLKLIEFRRKVLTGGTSGCIEGDSTICSCTLTEVDSAKNYLLAKMYRPSDAFEKYIEDLARIYLYYGKFDKAIELAQVSYNELKEERSLSKSGLESELIRTSFWTEVCSRYFTALMEEEEQVDERIIALTVGLFVRFRKLSTLMAEMFEPEVEVCSIDSAEGDHTQIVALESTLMEKLCEEKKSILMEIIDYSASL